MKLFTLLALLGFLALIVSAAEETKIDAVEPAKVINKDLNNLIDTYLLCFRKRIVPPQPRQMEAERASARFVS